MSTLKDIQEATEGRVGTSSGSDEPPGTFTATTTTTTGWATTVVRVYLLRGVEGDPDAVVLGRTETHNKGGALVSHDAYRGSDLDGGYLLPRQGDSYLLML